MPAKPLLPFLVNCISNAHEHRLSTHIYRPLYSYRVVGYNMGVYRICKSGFEILWCEYLWVATFPCGGFGPPPRNLEI